MPAFKDLTNQRFGFLVVIERAETKNKRTFWKCKCDCGNIAVVNAGKMMSGWTKSCGHYRNNLPQHFKVKHGLTESKEFKSWASMLTRCNNPNYAYAKDYGGRGITVCPQWQGENGFITFLKDMGLKPTTNHSIERVDNNGNYCPENCEWATRKTQNRNKRSNIWYDFHGEKMLAADIAEKIGVLECALKAMLDKHPLDYCISFYQNKKQVCS